MLRLKHIILKFLKTKEKEKNGGIKIQKNITVGRNKDKTYCTYLGKSHASQKQRGNILNILNQKKKVHLQ